MRTLMFGAALVSSLVAAQVARAEVDVTIDLSTQHMHVQSATGTFDWPVSTAREGYVTPTGTYKPERMMPVYFSKKYDNAPMPHAIFFYYGFAIHGTNEVRHLGHTASHGCVRLAPGNAAKLYSMVQAEGATINIVGTPPWQSGVSVASAGSTSKTGLLSIFGF